MIKVYENRIMLPDALFLGRKRHIVAVLNAQELIPVVKCGVFFALEGNSFQVFK